MESVSHPSSTLLSSEAGWHARPHKSTTFYMCEVLNVGFLGSREARHKMRGHLGPGQKAFAAEIFMKREGGQRQEGSDCG